MDIDLFKKQLNFEAIAGLFFDISEERYPAADKILQLTSRLVDPLTPDIYARVHMKISLLSAIRNMVREVSPTRLYRTPQHRDDLLAAVLEALESLEDELEEIEETENVDFDP